MAAPRLLSFSLLLVLFASLLTSCEKQSVIHYKVKNVSSTPIKVVCVNRHNSGATESFMIATDDESTIAVIEQGDKKIDNYKENDSLLRDFTKMEIYRADTLVKSGNFRETARWIYFENDTRSADYLLIIREEDK